MSTSPVWSPGQLIVGGVFVTVPTITSKSQSTVFVPSLAVTVIVVVPTGIIAPAAGDCVYVNVVPQLSVAVIGNVVT